MTDSWVPPYLSLSVLSFSSLLHFLLQHPPHQGQGHLLWPNVHCYKKLKQATHNEMQLPRKWRIHCFEPIHQYVHIRNLSELVNVQCHGRLPLMLEKLCSLLFLETSLKEYSAVLFVSYSTDWHFTARASSSGEKRTHKIFQPCQFTFCDIFCAVCSHYSWFFHCCGKKKKKNLSQ